MKISCMAIETDGRLIPLPEQETLARWREGKGPFWIDLESISPQEFITWSERLDLDPRLHDMLSSGEPATRIMPLRDVVYFEYPTFQDEIDREPENFACLIMNRLVVTIREKPDRLAGLGGAHPEEFRLPEPNAMALVSAILLLQSVRLRRLATGLRDQIRTMAERMDIDPDDLDHGEIVDLKRDLRRLDGVVSDQLAVYDLLQAADTLVLSASLMPALFQVAHGNIQATDRTIDRLQSAARDLQQGFEAAQADKLNRRLAVLTILSAIFMPLTLLSGIYGMNFSYMPELTYHWAYPVALGFMGLLAGGLYWYFKSRGWFR